MKFPRYNDNLMKMTDKDLILFKNNRQIFAQVMLEAGKEKTEELLRDIRNKDDEFQTSIRLPSKKKL
jgi:hypothetical protein